MKNFIKAILGKKALVIMLVLVSVVAVLDVMTSIRLGIKVDYATIGIIYSAIAIWADGLSKKETPNEKEI